MNLPMDQDAELQVVGAMMIDPEQVLPVLEVLDEEHFAFQSCRVVFGAIKRLSRMGHDVDPVAVRHMLDGDTSAQERIVDAIGMTTFPRHAVQHANTVRDLAGLRSIANVGQDLVDVATAPGSTFSDALERAEQGVFGLSRNGFHAVDWAGATDDALDRLEYRHSTDEVVTGLRTGLDGLDQRLTGLQPGWFVIIGARPGEGKTALALQTALNVAESGVPVMFVSLEMSATELANRAICARAAISYTKVRRSTLAPSDWARFVTAQGELSAFPIEMYDEGVETVGQIVSRVRRSKPGLLVVDYIQLMRSDAVNARRDLDIAEITRGLKLLAKSAGIPVVACAQLNRAGIGKDGTIRAPELQDLREGGTQEQDADVVILLHRKDKDPNYTDALIRKFRHGPTGVDKLRWHADITRFADGY